MSNYVTTADGTLAYVQRSYVDGTRELWLETGATVTLPADELTPAKNPRRTMPPIKGMPPRPVCPFCQKKLRVVTNDTYAPHDNYLFRRRIRREFVRFDGYGSLEGDGGRFCTLNCALHFARAACRAGYRIVRATGGARK